MSGFALQQENTPEKKTLMSANWQCDLCYWQLPVILDE